MEMRVSDVVDVRPGVAARLERLPFTRYQKVIFAVVATAWLFDSIDLGIMTFILGSVKTEFGLDALHTGWVASSSFLGMLIGAAVAGVLGDRFGRKPVFQVSMIFWGAGSLACAFAPDMGWLMAFRVMLGFGMGMEFPIGLSIVSELLPTKNRGKYLGILEGFWPIGFIVSGVATYFLLPHIGWRGLFIALAIPAAFVFVVRRKVPESPRWLESRGRNADADQVIAAIESNVCRCLGHKSLPPIPAVMDGTASETEGGFSQLWKGGYAKRTIMTWALWFFALLGYYGLTTWLGALLQEAGYAVTKSVFYTIVISLAGIPGFIFSSWLLEAWGRKGTCTVMLIGSAAFAYLYGRTATLHLDVQYLIGVGLCMQFFFFGMWSVLYAYTPELYPTRIRATGTGLASSVGRFGSLLGPSIVGAVLPVAGPGGVFTLGASSFGAAALAVLVLGTETRGRSLEDVSH
ncbi:MFS transporter [Trinickia mobilis]|uniref:MFS transporter n=1 Tax=Trinickia mobilis TaxID=2816356 RepID=UPI001A8D8A14|nr:MFS transporter [Trinickia mobilis]